MCESKTEQDRSRRVSESAKVAAEKGKHTATTGTDTEKMARENVDALTRRSGTKLVNAVKTWNEMSLQTMINISDAATGFLDGIAETLKRSSK